MNAGRLPADHWVNDPEKGGGRILGEACHAFDFMNFLTGSDPLSVQAMKLRSPDPEVVDDDNLSATVSYADGSLMTLIYSTAGPKGYPKEQLEVFAPGLAATLTDFRELVYLVGDEARVAEFAPAALSTWLTIQALESARRGEVLEVASTLPGVLGA
jgi:predicted dehydrogenase